MNLSEAIKLFKDYTKGVDEAIAKNKKTAKARKNASYRKRRMAEATEMWTEMENIVKIIDQLMAGKIDQCFEDEKARITTAYTDYMELLKTIPVESTDHEGDEDAQFHIQKQDVRFDTIRKAIEDVETKMVSDQEEVSIAYCKVKLRNITELWERIQTSDENIEFDRKQLTKSYEDKMDEYETSVEAVVLYLQEKIEGKPNLELKEGVKVPRVKIPKFHGDYFKWVSFRYLFQAIIINNKGMSNAERMQVLKTNLDGEAEALISDLTISDLNFTCAWDRLTSRYDNNRVVVYKHLNKIMFQQVCKTDAKTMKKLLDTTDQVLMALKNLGRPVDQWDDWIIVIISQKLSEECRKDWERKVGNTTNLPTWDDLKKFMEEEFRMLEGLENGNKRTEAKHAERFEKKAVKSYQTTVETKNCPVCSEEHKMFSCNQFKKMDVKERWDLAKRQKMCFSCLNVHKDKLKCDKKKPCKKCDRKHSTWLHEDRKKEEITNAVGILSSSEKMELVDSKRSDEITSAFGAVNGNRKQVLLATTLISAKDMFGKKIILRALIDSGSQGSMITDRVALLLQLKSIQSTKYISGLGGNNTNNVRMVRLEIKPRFDSDFRLEMECYILKKLTKTLPNQNLCVKTWQHLRGLVLADPTFNRIGPIDVLLGTDVVSEIMLPGVIKGAEGTPMAQKTSLGWIVSGKIDPKYPKNEIKCLVSVTEDKDDLHKFWELEELNPKRTLTTEETMCEEFYQKNHFRDADGKFTVKVPFKEGAQGPERLGVSRGQCMARFLQLEKRLTKDDALRAEYVRVMNEYINLGHMKNVDNKPSSEKLYFIPHHAVIKPESLTTKTRVVFDASAKTSSGWSLNDCMFTGAKQQNDLMDILIKWRKHRIVFKADIEKMYRMIKLDDEDQRFHTILWRENPAEPIKEYQLTTVTFGTAAAPFMATRTLNQIAIDGEDRYPLTRQIINQDFYVDDLISGSNDVQSALEYKTELIEALKEGGLSLRKWTSNCQEILDSLPSSMTEKALQTFSDEDTTKALGLRWNPRTDQFNFAISWNVNENKITKRQLLSEASKIFDPLGWLAPTVINAKLYMQEVWTSKIGWDEEVSESIKDKWNQFRNELPLLEQISVDRWIHYSTEADIELHGFCDASEKAYAAVVYTKIKKGDQVEVKLITSKTRVAPISTKTTLPRLELCGAVLLSHLLKSVKESLGLDDVPIFAWSDSMITLGWLQGAPQKWKTFVGNRVSEVHATGITDWRHIKSEDNPADCASRGVMPGDLKNHTLWWTGPGWLRQDMEQWPAKQANQIEEESEQRIIVNVATLERNELLLGNSSWFKTVRIMGYVLRVKNRTSFGGTFTLKELDQAKMVLYKRCQQEVFPGEIHKLQNKQQISPKSRILQLNPFLDENGILRVGGRLQNAVIAFNNKHPIILPEGHETTKMIIKQIHLDTLHGGPQMMVNLLRKKFWIINVKRMANNEYKTCVNCRRFNSHVKEQLMGNLPKERVRLERAFMVTGVDYAGPIEVRSSRIRQAKIVKGYIAVFVCFGTRAIHLELVSDLSTPAFMAALNRFMARRVMCSKIYSDNGTNFVGSANKMAVQEKQWLNEKNAEIAKLTQMKGIEWSFIPPGSPNFGGLWERGVRSVKDHLKRTLKTTRLTFEEYSTVLCQIEACLNSRPLCPLTADIENLNALTPGHFLVGDALLAPPQPLLLDTQANILDRWRNLQLLQQHFWNRWSKEYVNQLQQRQKWKKGEENVNKNDMVLVKDEQLPPRNWLLGRIEEVHPGKDEKVRVVTIRTQKGIIKRPISKVCPLVKHEAIEAEHQAELENSRQQLVEVNLGIGSTDGSEIEEMEQPSTSRQALKLARSQDQKKKSKNPGKQKKTPRTVESQHEPRMKTRYGMRPRLPNAMTMIIAILGLLALLGGGSTAKTDSIQVIEFENNAGIYFENLGKASVVRTTWHLYIRFGLTKYMYEFKRLQDITKELKNLCDGTDSAMADSHCEDITGILSHNMNEIKKLNVLLKSNGEEMSNRAKLQGRNRRAAPLNVIGWMQHEVFGVMASDQSDHIEKQFSLVEQNADHLLHLVKNQTSIVENTVNLMKATQDDINQNYGKIGTAINLMKNETNRSKRNGKLIGLAVFTSLLVNRVEKVQQNMLDMITDVHQGHINSHVFTPQQFKEQLEFINNNLPVGTKLPENAQHDFKSLYKMLRSRARVTEKSIMIDIMIPLVSTTEFQLLHIVPIPTEHQGNQITVTNVERKKKKLNFKYLTVEWV